MKKSLTAIAIVSVLFLNGCVGMQNRHHDKRINVQCANSSLLYTNLMKKPDHRIYMTSDGRVCSVLYTVNVKAKGHA